jgi:hypothetical protein
MIEIRQNADGSIDEVVSPFACCNVHLESLGDGNWSLILSAFGDIEHIAHVTITPQRAFVYESTNCKVICTDKPSDPTSQQQQGKDGGS